MMSDHVDDERIQRLLHGELPRALQEETRQHLEGCGRCRERVEHTRLDDADVATLLRELDHLPPPVAAASVIQRAVARPVRRRRLAAGLILALALSGTAYAASAGPESAVRRVLSAMVDWARDRDAAEPGAPPPQPAGAAQKAGIAVTPGTRFEIVISAPLGGLLEIRLTEAPDVTVQAPADAATFTSDDGRMEISSSRSTTFLVQIPRSARSLVIVANGRQLYEKQGREIAAVVSPDADGTYRIPIPVSPTRN